MAGPEYHAWTHDPDGTDPIDFPAGASTSPTLYLPFAPGVVVAHRENVKRFPGGCRVVPAAGFNSNGTVFNGIGFARQQVKHDQTAANYAAAVDTIVGTTEDWDLEPGRTYVVWVGFRPAAAVVATGHINMEAGGTNSDMPTAGSATARYCLDTLAERSFTAGQTITIRVYHTTASAGDIELDQLYFFPKITVYDETVGTGFYGDRLSYTDSDIPNNASRATGVTAGADTTFGVGTSIVDTQIIDWLWDTAMRASAWGGQFTVDDHDLIADYGSVDFEQRNPRHLYVQARVKRDASEGINSANGGHITYLTSGGKHETCSVISTCAGWYYLGLTHHYFGPDQWILWRNNPNVADEPWIDTDGSLVDDVRLAYAVWMSSVLDDH